MSVLDTTQLLAAARFELKDGRWAAGSSEVVIDQKTAEEPHVPMIHWGANLRAGATRCLPG